MIVINTRGMEVVDWCDRTAGILASVVRPMKLMNPDEWTRWALHAVQSPDVAKLNPPNPLSYTDWREWADRFNQVISSL